MARSSADRSTATPKGDSELPACHLRSGSFHLSHNQMSVQFQSGFAPGGWLLFPVGHHTAHICSSFIVSVVTPLAPNFSCLISQTSSTDLERSRRSILESFQAIPAISLPRVESSEFEGFEVRGSRCPTRHDRSRYHSRFILKRLFDVDARMHPPSPRLDGFQRVAQDPDRCSKQHDVFEQELPGHRR